LERVVFADGWQEVFSDSGYKTFNSFFKYNSGEIINEKGKRNVQSLTIRRQGAATTVFVKRFNYPHFKDLVGSYITLGRILSQAAMEWENANFLLSKDIGTYKPVCFGEKTILGIERKSFFVSERIEGQCLTDFVGENWSKISRQQKEELMAELGRFVRKIHDAGINFPDLYVWHIYLNDNRQSGKIDFSIIDLHRMQQNVTELKKQIHNLGRFKYSMLDKYFDESLYKIFIESYAGVDRLEDADELAAKVIKYSHRLLGKRNQKNY
jgi:tRNA A-37 threonylcarbamoyl transferase component Bud32